LVRRDFLSTKEFTVTDELGNHICATILNLTESNNLMKLFYGPGS